MDFLGGIVLKKNGQIHRYRLSPYTFHNYLIFGSYFLYGPERQVGISIIIKPALPEPVQVFSGTGVHGIKKVKGSRMPAVPMADIILKAFIKSSISQHFFYIQITEC